MINSSKRSTYDPRKAKDAERKKSYAIRKRYKKLKEKVGEIKTYDLHALGESETGESKRMVKKEVITGVQNETKEEKKESRTKQRKKMFKKTHSGQPVMKYRIEKILESIRK